MPKGHRGQAWLTHCVVLGEGTIEFVESLIQSRRFYSKLLGCLSVWWQLSSQLRQLIFIIFIKFICFHMFCVLQAMSERHIYQNCLEFLFPCASAMTSQNMQFPSFSLKWDPYRFHCGSCWLLTTMCIAEAFFHLQSRNMSYLVSQEYLKFTCIDNPQMYLMWYFKM